jgi:hypothetical protein
LVSDETTDGTLSDYVHPTAKQVFEVLLDGDDVQQGSTCLELYQKVYVTVWPALAARARTKDTHIARPVTRRDGKDLTTFLLQLWVNCHIQNPSPCHWRLF